MCYFKKTNRIQLKFLPFLISFLLFPSLLIGQSSEKAVFYKWETSNGINWKKFGEETIHDKYEGESIRGNKPEGVGTLFYVNGDKYIGEFVNGVKEGVGTYFWSNQIHLKKYVGEFENGKFGKLGKIYYKSGQIFEGEVFSDLYYGKGVKSLPNGVKYVGVWRRKKNNEIWKWEITGYDKDEKVILEISEGNGWGLYVFVDGDKYEGEFKDGKKHGQGIFTYSDGDMYEGKFKDGLRHGQGTMIFTGKDKYEGEFKDGKKHGQGTYTYSEGRKYVGEWKDGLRHGLGTYTLKDGRKIVGKWREGKKWDVTDYNRDGKIFGIWENGLKQCCGYYWY